MPIITPSLWFDNNCEEALNYYVSVFPDSKIVNITYYPENASDPHLQGMKGKVLHSEVELNGHKFVALDGGPLFKFNEAVSFIVECEDQKEIDYYWENLSAVPEAEQCGWAKDKFGLSWQIIPKNMGELMSGGAKSFQALLQMHKIDIAELEAAKN